MSSALTEWSAEFENGISWQDQQHRELIQSVHKLYGAILSKQSDDAIQEIVNFLYNYTKNHFDMEERYMEAYLYPETDAHVFQHRSFIKMLEDFEEERRSGKTLANLALCYDLNKWTLNHIKTEDQRFADFLRVEGES
ncbi:MAG: hemerythrin family protein [Chlorobiales bacterium]|jgi:hemerythrin|nr:hemerythrin family protein [Chlorobiales bacterium]